MTEPSNLPPELHDHSVESVPSVELAGRGARLVAQLIDATIIGTFSLLALYPLGYFDSISEGIAPSFMDSLTGMLVGMGVFFVVQSYFLYRDGQTIGKKWVGIRIADLNGEVPAYFRIIGLRFLPVGFLSLLPFVGRLFTLVDVLFIFRRDRRCLHDLIAGTQVVKAKRGPMFLAIFAFILSAIALASYMLVPTFIFFSLDTAQKREVLQDPAALHKYLPSWALQKNLIPGLGLTPKEAYINKLDRRCAELAATTVATLKLKDETAQLEAEFDTLLASEQIEEARAKYKQWVEKGLLATDTFTKTVAMIDALYRDLKSIVAPRQDAETLKQIWEYEEETIKALHFIADSNEKIWSFAKQISETFDVDAKLEEENHKIVNRVEQRNLEIQAVAKKQKVLATQYGFRTCFINTLQ